MTGLFIGLYILGLIFIIGIIILVILGILEYKDYVERIRINDETIEEPPLIEK